MLSVDIQAFTYEDRQDTLPRLTLALGQCSAWILDRRTVSPNQLEFRVELPLRSALDLYAAFAGLGVELTRAGHETLTDLCGRRKHIRHVAELSQCIALRFELTFLDDITLYSVLSASAGAA